MNRTPDKDWRGMSVCVFWAPLAKAVGRRSDLGNPYKVGSLGVPDRTLAAQLYEGDLLASNLRPIFDSSKN